jgi:biopolymer transport protein ExbD
MKIKPKHKSFISLESVAMTDIVMNLFIFFFISFSLLYTFNANKESKIEVKLPKGAAKSESAGAKPLVISVTQGNEVYIGKERVLPDALKKEFDSRSKSIGDAGIVVRSDKTASVETLVRVLDAAKQSGIGKLGVAVEE